MSLASSIVRQTLFAALLLGSHTAAAEIATRFDPKTGTLVVSGLEAAELAGILAEPDRLRLQAAAVEGEGGMLVGLSQQGDALRITPQFPLRPGSDYALALRLPHGTTFDSKITLPQIKAAAPQVTGIAPSQAVIPANALRLYLSFSQPMAAGQAANAIHLLRHDGSLVPSPFLNLEAELWDRSQTRLTLIFDPGRLKQGVGPNTLAGAPLLPGEGYKLVVSGSMQSAAGVALGTDHVSVFRVAAPNRRALTLEDWGVLLPQSGTTSVLKVTFDRLMDDGAVRRLLRVLDPAGQPLHGQIVTDGQSWTFTPEASWQPGTYRLEVDPALEDVSGNTTSAAFDAKAGTIAKAAMPTFIDLVIGKE